MRRFLEGPAVTRYLIHRLLLFVPVIFLVTVILFILLRITPGDPVRNEFGLDVEDAQVSARREELGLNRPIYIQYVSWVERMVTLDFGKSIRARQPTKDLIAERVPATLELGLIALILGIVIAVPLGTLAAVYRDSPFATVVTTLTLASVAVPGFFFSTMLVFFFTYKWRVVETPHYVPFTENPWVNLRNVLLPAIAISHGTVAVYTRFIRSAMLEEMGRDYVRTAKAKGLKQRTVVLRHALRNGLIPSVTLIGLTIFTIWEGAVVTERIFNWPGVGRLALTSLTNKDYPVVQAIVFMGAISVLLGNLAVDIIYTILDPRISFVHRQ
jgi:peptide/nickel transport system permease protein